MEIFLSAVGFIILLGSGHFLVSGSVSLSRHFGISRLAIGLTVVAFGTSAPELIISVQSALRGHPEIALGNVIGSNISNIALVLAIAAIITPVVVKRSSVLIDWSVMMLSGVLFYLLALNGKLGLMEGIIFCLLLLVYVVFSMRYSHIRQKELNEVKEKPIFSLWTAIMITVISCAGLVFGANILIDNAVIIAGKYGVSERVISITLIAVGTSLPELATSVIAAFKKESDISVGNILGSNIFNIFSVLGVTAIVKPIPVSEVLRNFDTLWMLGISALLFFFFLPLRNSIISRFNGLLLLLVYITYIYLVFTLK